ncbi:hypothetical protein J2752_000760 [Halarchaeum rubridurum]|uniref:Uncharacterized protein n=1 Tax=Halarchaeum rubridurum TaxID=489911 RepID=A0A830FXP1_9EURY|nr:hypothetical protein [Halarchaeum rubridurum]MBP1953879.1 hypothetical protein [Halarchaeum rubridurum]GGM55566.1 hypothetical protein GCM10009017_02200 [Halarchaeum rubridurum]
MSPLDGGRARRALRRNGLRTLVLLLAVAVLAYGPPPLGVDATRSDIAVAAAAVVAFGVAATLFDAAR